MPIGFDSGGFGGGSATATREPVDPWAHEPASAPPMDERDPWRHAPEEPAVPAELGFWTWVEVDASIVYPVVWTRWVTRTDERVCPECGPLDGAVWEEGAGVAPPLHVNCRCARVHAFTEWRTRYATTWALRWIAW